MIAAHLPSPWSSSMSGIRRREALGMLAGATAGGLGWSEFALAQGREAPRRGGTFVMAIGANPEHLNLTISSSVIIAFPGQAVTEGLVRTNSKFGLEPVL